MYNYFSSPTLANIVFSGNISNGSGGGMHNNSSSPILTNVVFSGNNASNHGGGMFNFNYSSPTLINVVFSGNISNGSGGGMNNNSSSPILTNVLLSGNKANNGGGMYNYSSSPTLANVVLSGNTASTGGGMSNSYYSSPKIRNSIIYNNSSGINNGNSTTDISYSLIQGLTSTANGNISGDTDPMFVNAPSFTTAPFTDGDYSLKPCSPVINKANNDLIPAGVTTDLAGNPRRYSNSIVDMGAYEYQGIPVLPPTASAQSHPTGSIVANLTPNGAGIKWYAAEFGGNELTATTPLAAVTYYVSQTIDGCESARKAVTVALTYPIKYVKQTASGTGSGTSWANASGDIQAMINADDTEQVWVAAGTYKPTVKAGNGTHEQEKAFVLKEAVKVYGGFAGTENQLTQRNWFANITILSGDLGIENNDTDNALHVVISAAVTNATELDGFTITAGNANGNTYMDAIYVNGQLIYEDAGGGIANSGSAAVLKNLIVKDNKAYREGGGIDNYNSSIAIINTVICGNTAQRGGGIYNLTSTGSNSPAFTNVQITGNIATGTISLGGGGAVYNDDYNSPKFVNVTISGNKTVTGGTIHNDGNLNIDLKNSIVYGNTSGFTGGNYTHSYSIIQGVSNASLNPRFIDAPSFETAPFTNGDYRLASCSYAINNGWYGYIPSGITTDLEGNPRRYNNSQVDMGAYEYQAAPGTPAPTANTQSHTIGATVANLTATGQSLKWYSTPTGGTALTATTNLTAKTYYVSQTIDGCESTRTAVIVTIVTYPIKYVKQGGTGNGTSWANASGDIQAMIDAPGTEQVWIAAGTYLPTVIAGNGTGERDKAFVLKENVKVYGGFAGTETQLSGRNWTTNVTVLSGDLGVPGDRNDNAYHVVIASGVPGNLITNSTVLDGFSITGGQATDHNWQSIIVNGGYIVTSAGGGIATHFASPTLINLKIYNNHTNRFGGGISLFYGSSPMITNTVISGNTSDGIGGGGGGGIAMSADGLTNNPVLTNVVITGNTALYGSAIYNRAEGKLTLINTTISGNTATDTFGGVIDMESFSNIPLTLRMRNTLIYGNSSGVNGVIIEDNYNNLIQGLTSTANGNISGDINPVFVAALHHTAAPTTGGDYSLSVLSPVINKGVNSFLPEGITTDLAGNPRIFGDTVDMGAYEYQGNAECAITTTWTAAGWSHGAPTSTVYAAIIDGDFTSVANLTACSLTVVSGNVIVNSGHNFIIKGKVTVNNPAASLTFENDANLVQADNVANEGDIYYHRDSNPLQYLDYTLWSSPTYGGQTLKMFSPLTLDTRFYVYNTALNAYSNYTSPSGIFGDSPGQITFTPAKGYLIRMADGLQASPPTGPALTSVFHARFTGVPNNGNISIALGTGGNRFNAVGNPYPSPINIWDFIDANTTQLDNGTLYLWRKTNNAVTTTYATVTKLDYIANEAAGGNVVDEYTGVTSNWAISAGQGFFVKAAQNATSLVFNNSMRRAVNNTLFFRMPGIANNSPAPHIELSRYKLNIKNTGPGFGQAAVGYTNITTNGLDYGWDGRLLNDGDLCIYTTAVNARLGIQARAAFSNTDVVPLGYKAANAGNITISLSSFDGLFAEGQNIYLKDNLLSTIQNLKLDSYTFESGAGTFDNRFEIIYINEALGTDENADTVNHIIVYKQEDVLHVTSGKLPMEDITVYDTRGRLIYSKEKINDTKATLTGLRAEEQVLIVKVKTENGGYAAKKVIY